MADITPLPLYSREKLDTHWIGDGLSPRARLDVLRKKYIFPVRIRTPDLPSPSQVSIPTTLSRPIILGCARSNIGWLVVNAVTRERFWHNWCTTPELTCNDREESRYSSVSIVDVLADTSTKKLPNTSHVKTHNFTFLQMYTHARTHSVISRYWEVAFQQLCHSRSFNVPSM